MSPVQWSLYDKCDPANTNSQGMVITHIMFGCANGDKYAARRLYEIANSWSPEFQTEHFTLLIGVVE
jgi:hypothetical protein